MGWSAQLVLCLSAGPNNGQSCENGKNATFRNEATVEGEFDATDNDLHVGKIRACCNDRLSVTQLPVCKSRDEMMRTSRRSYGHRSVAIDSRQ
jgi:hypothetical protein